MIAGQFKAEGHRLGMDTVAAAHARRELVFLRPGLECGQNAVDAFDEQV
jgi:hypothetical protein